MGGWFRPLPGGTRQARVVGGGGPKKDGGRCEGEKIYVKKYICENGRKYKKVILTVNISDAFYWLNIYRMSIKANVTVTFNLKE